LDAKFFDIRIEHELFAGDQSNAQQTSVALELFPRHALDKGMIFEEGGPNGGEIISLAYQFGAMAREIAGSLLGHFFRPIRFYASRRQSMTLALATRYRFAIYNYMRDKNWRRIISVTFGMLRNMSFHI
jgi:hypothetical protein